MYLQVFSENKEDTWPHSVKTLQIFCCNNLHRKFSIAFFFLLKTFPCVFDASLVTVKDGDKLDCLL